MFSKFSLSTNKSLPTELISVDKFCIGKSSTHHQLSWANFLREWCVGNYQRTKICLWLLSLIAYFFVLFTSFRSLWDKDEYTKIFRISILKQNVGKRPTKSWFINLEWQRGGFVTDYSFLIFKTKKLPHHYPDPWWG